MHLIQSILNTSLMSLNNKDMTKWKALQQIANCHTNKMGYLVLTCNNCNHQEIIPKSCRNRNCPICQKSAQEKWVNKWLDEMVDCSYYHIVATTPNILYQISYQNQVEMYKILQKASAKAIMKLCEDEKYLGAKVGMLQILHTWTQRMFYHPHCHMLVTAGGVREEKWVDAKNKKYLFPIKVYSKVYRGIYIEELKKIYKKLHFYNEAKKYEDESKWRNLINELYKTNFITYVKEPYDNPVTVMDYFGRYAYRVAISESRILKYENGYVSFKYKDRKDGNKEKIETISDKEFVQRFAQHILPKQFRKIKAYGIYANAFRKERIVKIKKMIYKIRHRILEFVKTEQHKKSCSVCGCEAVQIVCINTSWRPT